MSKDITVLTPHGRRQKVHCTPDTSMLQVLEEVCNKHGFQPSQYDLKHHNHVLDLTTTMRFSNLPNKATLEMVEAERKREETIVTVGLLLEDGERRTGDFSPNTSLFDLVSSLAATEMNALQQPTILYMRQEVAGLTALQSKTLRQLGLIGGRAILRLLNKTEEPMQANVSTVYRRPISKNEETTPMNIDESQPCTSNVKAETFDPVNFIKSQKLTLTETESVNEPNKESGYSEEKMSVDEDVAESNEQIKEEVFKKQQEQLTQNEAKNNLESEQNFERRLRIEEEVTFIGGQKAIAFMQPDGSENELEDLPDDFYDLSIDEVRKLYHDLRNDRLQLENTPLMTSTKKMEIDKQVSQRQLDTYKNVVVRIQFPDHLILQGIFTPSNTIEDVTNFVKEHLHNPDLPFHIFTTPLKETLDPKTTLLEARFVPCVHMHFKWLTDAEQSYLKQEIYGKQTSSDAAMILASKYRAPSRRKTHEVSNNSPKASTSNNSKVPKWFRNS